MNSGTSSNNVLGLRGNTVSTRQDSTSNTDYRLTFCKNGKREQPLLYDSSLIYNPSTDTLTVSKIAADGSLLTNLPGAQISGNLTVNSITTGSILTSTIAGVFAPTSTGGYQYVLFTDPTAPGGKQLLYSPSNFRYNPTLNTFNLLGSLQTGIISAYDINFSGLGSSNITNINQLTGSSKTIDFAAGTITGFTIQAAGIDVINDTITNTDFRILFTDASGSNQFLKVDTSPDGLKFNPSNSTLSGLTTIHAGLPTSTSNLSLNPAGGRVGIGLTSPTYQLDVYDTTSFHCKTAVRSLDQTLEIASYYQAGVGQYTYLQSRQEATPSNNSNLVFNPSGGNVGIGLTNPLSALHVLGLKAAAPATRGIHLGEDSVDGNNSIELVNDSGDFSYLDFTKVNTDYNGRISYTHSSREMNFSVSSRVMLTLYDTMASLNCQLAVGRAFPLKELDVLHLITSTGFSHSTMSAMFQTSAGGSGGKHGIGIGGDVITGNGFLQSIFNDFSSGYNILLQPIAGNVGIGMTSSPTSALQISQGANTRASIDGYNVYWNADHTNSSTNGSLFFGCQYNGGFIGYIYQATTNSIAIQYTSDYRVKENVIEMPGMLERVKQLRPVQFSYRDDSQDSLGFIAHEFKEVFPNNAIVRGEKDAMMNVCTKCSLDEECCKCDEPDCQCRPDLQGMDYAMLTPILVKAVQELAGENQELRSELETVQARLTRETEELRSELSTVQAQYSALLERVIKLERAE